MLQGCRSDPLPFGRRKNPPTKIVTEISVCKFGGWKFGCGTVSTTCIVMQRISDNASHSIRSELFNRVKPDRVTICDAIRRADAFLFLNIWRIIVFSQQAENQHFFDLFKEAPYILTMNRIIVIHSLSLLNSNLEKSSQVRFIKISVSVFMLIECFRPSSFFGRSKALSYHSTQIEIDLSIKTPPFLITHNKSPTTQISSRASVISMPIFFTILYNRVNFVGINSLILSPTRPFSFVLLQIASAYFQDHIHSAAAICMLRALESPH